MFQPTDKAYNEISKIKVAEISTYAYPIPAGNKLIVEDQDSVAALAVE